MSWAESICRIVCTVAVGVITVKIVDRHMDKNPYAGARLVSSCAVSETADDGATCLVARNTTPDLDISAVRLVRPDQ